MGWTTRASVSAAAWTGRASACQGAGAPRPATRPSRRHGAPQSSSRTPGRTPGRGTRSRPRRSSRPSPAVRGAPCSRVVAEGAVLVLSISETTWDEHAMEAPLSACQPVAEIRSGKDHGPLGPHQAVPAQVPLHPSLPTAVTPSDARSADMEPAPSGLPIRATSTAPNPPPTIAPSTPPHARVPLQGRPWDRHSVSTRPPPCTPPHGCPSHLPAPPSVLGSSPPSSSPSPRASAGPW